MQTWILQLQVSPMHSHVYITFALTQLHTSRSGVPRNRMLGPTCCSYRIMEFYKTFNTDVTTFSRLMAVSATLFSSSFPRYCRLLQLVYSIRQLVYSLSLFCLLVIGDAWNACLCKFSYRNLSKRSSFLLTPSSLTSNLQLLPGPL